jgi:hypothetical protein
MRSPLCLVHQPDHELSGGGAGAEPDDALSASALSAGRSRLRSITISTRGGSPPTTRCAQIPACRRRRGLQPEVDGHWPEDASGLETELFWVRRRPPGPWRDATRPFVMAERSIADRGPGA